MDEKERTKDVYFGTSLEEVLYQLRNRSNLKICGGCTYLKELPPVSMIIRNIKEFKLIEPDNGSGESTYRMIGDFVSESCNTGEADHILTDNNYISIVPHTLDSTDYAQLKILDGIDF